MASEDAKNVAREVLETIGNGNKVVLGKIIKRHGYSDVTAKVPSTVTETKSYKEITEPFINKMMKDTIKERNRRFKNRD